MGSIFFQKGDKEKGISFFEKVDSIYDRKSVLYPELPVVYDKLATYYAELGDQEQQLAYMQKLLLVVKLINIKRVYIKDKIAEEYEIPKLLEEKDALIEGLEAKHQASQEKVWLIGGVLLFCLGLLGYYIKRQQTYRKRFELLTAKNTQVEREEPVQVKSEKEEEGIDISEEIVADILVQLQQFEAEKKYLSPDIKLTQLAKDCNTNSTYLSKVINYKKGKNFSSYLNELRVSYAFKELRDNPTFRKYTIKAVAFDCGFKSAESFSKAFYKTYGIYPSYYSKQLMQQDQ
ncbi:MAG: helix-turn-helix transcriptional regulator, partial [Marinirhabdus sp.]|nr:helix-turn-helix transcriptional regulator [Marinirhabdus sp.]